jgi:predicted GIY-YIG superfamily endonuclease
MSLMLTVILLTVMTQDSQVDSARLKSVVTEAFLETHQGFSSDEVILQTELNRAFIAACKKQLPGANAATFNWTLINLRKAGKLPAITSRRVQRSKDSPDASHIGEICARMVMDRHGVSIDRVMTDPALMAEFNESARKMSPDADVYQARKSAFRLRKTRKLKPELITRIADWGRKVTEYRANELAGDTSVLPESPGIYLFRDSSGYLYIGEAIDLRKRLTQHLDESDRKALGNYLNEQGFEAVIVEVHTFAKNSRIKEIGVRRAYESELIRSREPRFNVRP